MNVQLSLETDFVEIHRPCNVETEVLEVVTKPIKSSYLLTDHVPASPDDPTTLERALKIGSDRLGRCGKCLRYFSSEGGFNRHQRLTDEGDVVCLDPLSLGMVVTMLGKWAYWSMPSSGREWYAKSPGDGR